MTGRVPVTCADLIVFISEENKFEKNIYIFIIFYSFLVDNWIEDPNTVINGPSSASQRNAIEMTLRCRADKGPTLNVGLVAL